MARFQLAQWAAWDFPKNWTHIVTLNASPGWVGFDQHTLFEASLFCYDRNSGFGAFYDIVRNAHLFDGTAVPDGPYKIGEQLFDRRWAYAGRGPSIPARGGTFVFQDAPTGPGAFADLDGRGGLVVFGQDNEWHTTYTNLVPGFWSPAFNFLLYSLQNGGGGLYRVDQHGKLHLHRSFTDPRRWHTIIGRAFRDGSINTDLLFYDKIAGRGQFYTLDDEGNFHEFSEHDNWRTTWTEICPGFFDQNPFFEGLLFYEHNNGHTELYLTNGSGELTQLDVSFGPEWGVGRSRPWDIIRTIVRARVVPIGLPYTSGVCTYSSQRGVLAMFRIVPG